jgi:cytochrome c oxidase assembly protein subunit 15
MTTTGLGTATPLRARLATLSAHLLVALVALVAIGGATRVMEAGLACPDWPLCYGSLLPGHRMNLQVFLEWFHRLDAFVVGVGLVVLAAVSCWCRRQLPTAIPVLTLAAAALVALQGALGALTVTLLLPFPVVTAHLLTALLLVAVLSACTQALLVEPVQPSGARAVVPSAWPWLTALVAVAVLLQCTLGGLMATQWATGSCLASGEACSWLLAHRHGARAAAAVVLLLAGLTLWRRPRERPLAALAAALVLGQIALGIWALRLSLSVPAVTVAHQVGAALLVAVLAALVVRSRLPRPQSLEVSHG